MKFWGTHDSTKYTGLCAQWRLEHGDGLERECLELNSMPGLAWLVHRGGGLRHSSTAIALRTLPTSSFYIPLFIKSFVFQKGLFSPSYLNVNPLRQRK